MTKLEVSRDCARRLDGEDPLREFRDRFDIPEDRNGRNCVYVCGNSLGLRPKNAVGMVEEVLDDWARLAVLGHFQANRPWTTYHRLANQGFADLTGAKTREVVAMNTLTVNLHVLMASFYRPKGRKRKIVIESTAFPSDYFAVASQIRLHGLDPADCLVEWRPREDDLLYTDDLAAILEAESGEIALLLLPGVQYYSGQVLEMAELCRLASERDIRIGLDLAHAIGNVALELHDWAPDFAAWCTYKYLNAGPGAIGGAFIHSRHLDGDGSTQLTGWWGHDESTPVLALAPIVASLDVFEEAGFERLLEKSKKQAEWLRFLLEQEFEGEIGTITPPDAQGCQFSLIVRQNGIDSRCVFRALENFNVIGDWREPNVIRVAPVPLYNSFEDIYDLSLRLREAIDECRT